MAMLQYVEATFDPLPYDQDAARLYGQICAAVRAAGREPHKRSADLMIFKRGQFGRGEACAPASSGLTPAFALGTSRTVTAGGPALLLRNGSAVLGGSRGAPSEQVRSESGDVVCQSGMSVLVRRLRLR